MQLNGASIQPNGPVAGTNGARSPLNGARIQPNGPVVSTTGLVVSPRGAVVKPSPTPFWVPTICFKKRTVSSSCCPFSCRSSAAVETSYGFEFRAEEACEKEREIVATCVNNAWKQQS